MNYSMLDLNKVAGEVVGAARLRAAPNHATHITHSGNLGAGKTTLVQSIAQNLGITSDLQSPTYVIYKKYQIPESDQKFPWKYLIHADMYRLASVDELAVLGWNELLENPENLLCVEWPEQVSGAIPEWAMKVVLDYQGQTMRNIDF